MKQTIKLEQHNVETYEAIQEAFMKRNHIGTVQATGTGKSYIIAKAMQDSSSNNILFLAPSLHIIDEFKEKFCSLNDAVTFMTYKKLSYVKDLEKFLTESNFDFVILDEYHRCGAKTWGQAVKTMLSIYPDKKVLGVTATPIRFLDNCRDMTKELFDSEPIVELSLLDAIEKDILKKPKYVLSYYDSNSTIKLLKAKVEVIDNEKILKNMKYIINNVDRLINIEDVLKNNITSERKFIVFCSNIEHVKAMSTIVPKWFENIGFETKIYSLYSDTENPSNSKKMKLELDEFKQVLPKDNEIHLLFSVNMLNEGLHIKGVDGLIFLRKTVSPVIASQQLGRALSVGEEKSPIVFDLVNNISELSFEDAFLNIEKGNKRSKKIKKMDYSILGDIEIKDYTADLNALLREVNELSKISSWKSFKELLIEFKNENGHCDVPTSHKLYKRCLNLKKRYEKGVLEEYQYNELTELGFNWEFSIYNDELWELMFKMLKEFVAIHGHANVPRSYKNTQLATWVHTQRKNKDTMPKERKEKLLSVGFEFTLAKKRNDERWELMFKKLLEFKKEFGHTRVSSRYKDKELANWVNSQKKAYKAGKMTPERYERLVAIGFEFPER